MTRLNLAIDRLFDPVNKTISLSIIRVYLAIHIILKYSIAWPYLGMIYGDATFAVCAPKTLFGSFLPSAPFLDHYLLFFSTFICLACLMAFGIGGRITIVFVFWFTVIAQKLNSYYLDGGDNMLKLALLYLCVCDSFQYFSLSKQSTKPTLVRINNLLTRFGIIALMVQFAVTYTSSGLAKVHSAPWTEGAGMYYSLINERFMGTSLNIYMVQYPLFAVIGNYFVMMWELSFGFLVWFRPVRWVCLGCGVLNHLSIYFLMSIRAFAILFIVLYVIFISDEEWKRIVSFLRGIRWGFRLQTPNPSDARTA